MLSAIFISEKIAVYIRNLIEVGSETTELESKVQAEVEKIIDPETGLTFGQMKLIAGLKEIEPGIVKIDFVPSSPFCPIAFRLALGIKRTAEKITGVKKALVYSHGHMMDKAINKMVNEEEKHDEG